MVNRAHLGSTGTRDGNTPQQWHTVRRLVCEIKPTVYRHGGCVGSDAQIHKIIHGFRLVQDVEIHVHPMIYLPGQEIWEAKDLAEPYIRHRAFLPITRNHHIVDNSGIIIATPKEFVEQKVGSGTWATIRYARRKEKEGLVSLIIVWPDGSQVGHRLAA